MADKPKGLNIGRWTSYLAPGWWIVALVAGIVAAGKVIVDLR